MANEENKKNIEVSPELIGMSKEKALEYMELTTDANDYEIDERFWQLSKRIRSIKEDEEREQKMVDLSYALDVATGREEARLKALADREAAKKYFGKTSDEWKNYFGYTWYKYLIGLLIIIVSISIVKRVFFTPKEDIAVLTVGHYGVDVDVMDERLKNMGFQNPYTFNVDLVSPNDEGQVGNGYAEMSAAVVFASEPEIVVTDEQSVYYYFGQFDDMQYYYDLLKEQLPIEAFAKIKPLYYSEYENALLSIEYQEKQQIADVDRSELDTASHEQILIGLEIKDQELIEKLGYTSLWYESEPCLIFSFGVNGDNRSGAEEALTAILSELS